MRKINVFIIYIEIIQNDFSTSFSSLFFKLKRQYILTLCIMYHFCFINTLINALIKFKIVTNSRFNFARKNIALDESISLCEDKRVWRIHIVHRNIQTFHKSMIVERLRRSTKQHNKQIIIYRSYESCKLNNN